MTESEIERVEIRAFPLLVCRVLRIGSQQEGGWRLAFLRRENGGLCGRAIDEPVFLAAVDTTLMARMKGAHTCAVESPVRLLRHRLLLNDDELVAPILLAKAPDDVLPVVSLRQGGAWEQKRHKRSEGGRHKKLLPLWSGE